MMIMTILSGMTTSLNNFVQEDGQQLVTVIVLFIVARIALNLGLKLIIRRIHNRYEGRSSIVRENRAKTMCNLINVTGKVVIYAIIIIMILQLVGIDTTPILASAGVVGFAVGFGMQTIVKDFMSGLLIILENQYAVGDKVKIGLFEGTVYNMNTRSTILKDEDGNLIFIPNGSVTQVVNYSMKKHSLAQGQREHIEEAKAEKKQEKVAK